MLTHCYTCSNSGRIIYYLLTLLRFSWIYRSFGARWKLYPIQRALFYPAVVYQNKSSALSFTNHIFRHQLIGCVYQLWIPLNTPIMFQLNHICHEFHSSLFDINPCNFHLIFQNNLQLTIICNLNTLVMLGKEALRRNDDFHDCHDLNLRRPPINITTFTLPHYLLITIGE